MSLRRMRRLAWTLAGCGLLFLSPAFAQDQPVQKPQPTSWAERVPALLHLDKGQERAFQAYVETLPKASARPPSLTASQFGAMTFPQRLDYVADHVAADLSAVRAEADAMRRFYDSLTPEQRARLDQTTQPPADQAGVAPEPVDLPHSDTPDYNLPSHTNPDWMVKPRGEDMARVYPSEAQRRGLEGSVILSCTADENGYLKDCVVRNETPKDIGFGNAALEMSAYLRMTPASEYGVPKAAQVDIPLHFALEDDKDGP